MEQLTQAGIEARREYRRRLMSDEATRERRREYCRQLSGCLLPFGGMPGMSRADALHYIRTGIGTKQRRHRNKVWKAL